jgi:alanyl-tRNA synthetase
MNRNFDAPSLRRTFIAFFAERGHASLPSASLIPENDPTVLFTTAGMHPLVPFLRGEKHPMGKRLTNVQKCIRTQDIEEVGDRRHTTFFEMLGAWSLGDYFKESIIPWTFEFFTNVLGFEPSRLFISVFRGDETVPVDTESAEIWQALFKGVGIEAKVAPPEHPNVDDGYRIFQYGKDKNWWGPAGTIGPCGPDTEIFYDSGLPHDPAFGVTCHPNCDCGRFIEIGNDVFIEFAKKEDGTFERLNQRNVDIGWGLERLLAMVQHRKSVFETDVFAGAIRRLEEMSGRQYGETAGVSRSIEVIADHVRAATFILGDSHGISPSNVDQGYVLRRFIRRAIRHARLLQVGGDFLQELAAIYVDLMGEEYPELIRNRDRILHELALENQVFGKTLASGERHFQRLVSNLRKDPSWGGKLSGEDTFHLYDTFGFPLEMTKELARENGLDVDEAGYHAAYAKHQEISRSGAEQKFQGGLADHSDRTVRMHTATHLLHTALRRVLGPHVHQKGSNITAERLRFDFSHPAKMTPEQIRQVEDLVNEQVDKQQSVSYVEMNVDNAKAMGVLGDFEERYGDLVKVYTIGDFSCEICGGPHVANTRFIGRLKILKEEASSKGVRRIKAVVTDAPEFVSSPIPIAELQSSDWPANQ